MATLLLSVGGAAIGQSIGGSILGLSAASVGQALGGIAGSAIDSVIFGGGGSGGRVAAPELRIAEPLTATEGTPIERIWGTNITGGQLIWSSRYLVETVTTRQTTGGKGFGGGSTAVVEENRVSISMAVALCEGVIDGVGTIWADGYPIRKEDHAIRVYTGTETQDADPTIAAIEGAAPAYRGLAYIVFENFDLSPYGNRIPQMNFEIRRGAGRIARPAGPGEIEAVENLVRGVCLIPATGKWTLHPRPILRSDGRGGTAAVNRFSAAGISDVVASLDALQQRCPNVETVAIFVSWFGDDLRAGECSIAPRAESRDDVFTADLSGGNTGGAASLPTTGVDPTFAPDQFDPDAITGAGLGVYATGLAESAAQNVWRVSGVTLGNVTLSSETPEGTPAFGATPSDRSVFTLIREIRARGLKAVFYPFLLMDVPQGNGLPDPYGSAEQGAYPWRGRITGTDGDLAATAEIDGFFGSAVPGDFGAWNGKTIPYSGDAAAGGYRRMILHYAKLCAEAGGVDAFLIGSEMRGLTTLRDDTGAYPAVDEFRVLAADCRAILGETSKISYAADWSEYSTHRPDDGSGDVIFHLDPLWADPNIDFVGIDNYLPMSDWRPGTTHLDYDEAAGPRTVYDLGYLKSQVEGGELADYFYASDADRAAQIRSPLIDTAAGEHFVFGPKRIREWWLSAHHDRPGGVRSPSPTAWVPGSKPIVFTEYGCPAVDLGTNQPNVFIDPKSSEDTAPHFSTAAPDAVVQRQYLKALLNHWAENMPTNGADPMIDLSLSCAYCWDARPYPEFPNFSGLWVDAPQYETGHWLTGRLGQIEVGAILDDMAADVGLAVDRRAAFDMVEGYLLDGGTAPRGPMEQLAGLAQIDLVETSGSVLATSRIAARIVDVTADDLATGETDEAFRVTRGSETELPIDLEISFNASRSGFAPRTINYARRVGGAQGKRSMTIPAASDSHTMLARAERLLIEEWQALDRIEARLAPAHLDTRPGDLIRLDTGTGARLWRLSSIGWQWGRPVEAVSADPGIYRLGGQLAEIDGQGATSVLDGSAIPILKRIDLPLLTADAVAHAPYFAAFASPFPATGVGVWRSGDGVTFDLDHTITDASLIGALTAALDPGPTGVFDRANRIEVELFGGALESVTESALLSGANAAAVLGDGGAWEVLQFTTAQLIGPRIWRLSGLRRGRGGTEDAQGASPGAAFVLLSDAMRQPTYPLSDRGRVFQWRFGALADGPAGENVQAFEAGFTGRGLTPLAPAQPRAQRQPNGDIAFSFRRRSRLGGGGFGRPAPLGFEQERYRVRIWSGGDVLREIDGSAAPITYEIGDQIADFGGRPGAVDWSISQRDDAGAPGIARRQTERV